MTILFPESNSNELLPGIAPAVINSTSWLVSLLAPALLAVSVPRVTVPVIAPLVVLPKISPSIIVVVLPATV